MRYRNSGLSIAAALLLACSGESAPTAAAPTPDPDPAPPPAPTVLLKDIEIPNLPSPYYHFEYDTNGRVRFASFASGLTMYDVVYEDDRISEMRNNIIVNHDRLVYTYDVAGRVSEVRYVDSNGRVFTRLSFSYDGQRLISLERRRRFDSVFIVDKTMTLSYYPDGNLKELTEHRPQANGQPETTTIDRFENYDDKTNVDGFGLIHDDFFDHLVLLPGVQLQKGNPGKQTHTGDGASFSADFSYVYDENGRPLTKNGDVTLLSGSNAGLHVQTTSVFSYY